MSIALYRIDDRLIHGQVVVGWGQPLDCTFIVLVDDEVRGSDWEQDLYRMGVPPHIEIIFASVSEAAERLRFVYLSDDERAKLRQLAAKGVDVTAQDVPTARPVPLAEFA